MIREHRLLRDLEILARCTDTPGNGVTRFSWSEADRRARAHIESKLRGIGLTPQTDGIGNIRARMPGIDSAKTVILGSHFDSVKNGGRYDGTYGVVAALEVLRSFHDDGFVPPCNVMFIAFVEEEGSNFGCTCLGSKAICGQACLDDLERLRAPDGRNALAVLRDFSLTPQRLPEEQIDPANIAAYLEVHIEQNAVLEKAGKSLGLVSAICGMRLYEVCLSGRSDHAASPMQGRHDPMAGFTHAASRMEALCHEGALGEGLCCTIGSIACEPGVGIVIPERVRCTIDLRHVDVDVLEKAWADIAALFAKTAQDRGLALETALLSRSGGACMDARVTDALDRAARKLGVEPLSMVSGPAHDAASMGAIVPAGMLFVPSVGGLSHCAEEHTEPGHLLLGARVLEETVRNL